jgi:8-oxo-dGTP diphosphatase
MSCYRRVILATVIPCASLILSTTVALPPLSLFPRVRSSHGALYHLRHLSSQKMSAANDGNNYIDKLALILVNSDNKQLVARSFGKTVYYTPGGKRETGESDVEALVRECEEELDVHLLSATKTPATIEPYGTFQAQAYGKPDGTMVRMTCFRLFPREAEIELETLVKPSNEVEELTWADSTFDREKLTVTGIMILEDLKEKKLID